MSEFNISECAIPSVWCGKNNKPPKRKSDDDTYYIRVGTRYECMQKGFGAGTHTERGKNLPESSLQKIRYVGETYEKKFKRSGVKNLSELQRYAKKKSRNELEKYLKRIFTRVDKKLDQRAYNSCIVYLYRHGVGHVPRCSKI